MDWGRTMPDLSLQKVCKIPRKAIPVWPEWTGHSNSVENGRQVKMYIN